MTLISEQQPVLRLTGKHQQHSHPSLEQEKDATLPLVFNIVLESLANKSRKEKEIRHIKLRKKRKEDHLLTI